MSNIISAVINPHSGRTAQSVQRAVEKLVDKELGQEGVAATRFSGPPSGGNPHSVDIRVPDGIIVGAMLEFLSAFQKVQGLIQISNIPEPIWAKDITSIADLGTITFPTFGGAGTADRDGVLFVEAFMPVGSLFGLPITTFSYALGYYANLDAGPAGVPVLPFNHEVTPLFKDAASPPSPGLGAPFGGVVPKFQNAPRGGLLVLSPLVQEANKGGGASPMVVPTLTFEIKVDGRTLVLKLATSFSYQGDTVIQGDEGATFINEEGDLRRFHSLVLAIAQGDDGAGPGGADLVSAYPLKRDPNGALDYVLTLEGTAL